MLAPHLSRSDQASSSVPAPVNAPGRAKDLRPWPLRALLLLFPLWWAMGLAILIFPLLAVPMAWQLRRRRPIALPAGAGLWLLFLVSLFVSLVVLGVDPPETVAGSAVGRLPGVVLRIVEYVAVSIVAVYAYNLTEREMSQVQLVRLLGVMFGVTVAGGYLGLLAPTLEFTSPLEFLLPSSIRSNLFVQSLFHPAAAQLQEVLGYGTPRPAAPFGYTNTWGNSLSVLLPWFILGFISLPGARHRWLAGLLVVVAIVPAVYSLNRGLWIGLALTAAYVVIRNAVAGRLAALAIVVISVSLLFLVAVLTPVADLVSQRIETGKSNSIRVFTTQQTLEAVGTSPIIGLGSTRAAIGSSQSIAVGKSLDCPRCGNPTLGSNGQVWLMLMSQGLVGASLYTAFFLYGIWRFRRDRTAIGHAGVLVLLLALVYMFIYNALVAPLCFYLLAYVLLARNERLQGAGAAPKQHMRVVAS